MVTPPLKDSDHPYVFLYCFQTRKPKIKLEKDIFYDVYGVPTVQTILELSEKYKGKNSGIIVIYDDCLSAMENLPKEERGNMQKLIVEYSRHRKISLFFALQNTFSK